MKSTLLHTLLLLLLVAMTGCKANYDATKEAYEKAKEAAANRSTITESTPTDGAVTEVMPMVNNTPLAEERRESVRPVDDARFDAYAIVVGSFRQITNARSLRDRLIADGYPAVVVQNAKEMYRVIISSYTTIEEARNERKEVTKRYPHFTNTWILLQD